jgi:hypothetical protein
MSPRRCVIQARGLTATKVVTNMMGLVSAYSLLPVSSMRGTLTKFWRYLVVTTVATTTTTITTTKWHLHLFRLKCNHKRLLYRTSVSYVPQGYQIALWICTASSLHIYTSGSDFTNDSESLGCCRDIDHGLCQWFRVHSCSITQAFCYLTRAYGPVQSSIFAYVKLSLFPILSHVTDIIRTIVFGAGSIPYA